MSTKQQPGLKAQSKWRKDPRRNRIPRDADGAYRVEGRKDGLSIEEALNGGKKDV